MWIIGAVLSVAALPAAIWLHSTNGFLATDPADLKLAPLADSPVAANLWHWLKRDGFSGRFAVTCLPLLVAIPAVWWLLRDRSNNPEPTKRITLVLGPVIVLLVFACFRLRFWSVLEALLLVLFVVGYTLRANPVSPTRSRFWAGAALLCFLPGLWLLREPGSRGTEDAVNEIEAQSLVERDLAHWLSQRGGKEPSLILAPPSLTSSLIYFGHVRGLATPYWENFEGFAAAVRIAGATSMAEADSLMRRREVKFIVIPSWDADLTSYAKLGTTDAASSLIGRLDQWLPPLSLRPVSYKLPQISGFEGRSIAVFAATDMQDDALALSRLAEYFAEMAQLDFALRVSRNLQLKYPEDLNGLIARAQVAAAINDAAGFGESHIV